ncbi:MAG: TPM domain-containing protein, partial [Lachnospiraceae bacterium]|nr:TPM domain-containing protein [Lachnospiraceae bacterium]
MRRAYVKKLLVSLMLVLAVVAMLPFAAKAKDTDIPLADQEQYVELSGKNADSGYDVLLKDEAGLLTRSEADELMEVMTELAYYGNVVFYTISSNNMGYVEKADQLYVDIYGSMRSSGCLFLIDMDNRQLVLRNFGENKGDLRFKIGNSKAESIVDNSYKLATNGDYLGCAKKVFKQELTLLGGGKIAQPMRVASNAFLALIIALLLSYIIVKAFSKSSKPSEKEVLAAIRTRQVLNDYSKVFTHQTREYSP